ncbi:MULTISPECIES: YafY family protein [Kitasatospora]|uniref:Putative DeoR family transcriptional regulator n=1 Tax=Kitasatospora setae (strain ATCC 33774 / DSM 43861 / JCM 3304 / KCC A-0304 / NBRC 14216 / KM-6054) TaxID=452652 RepID=E4NE75_KITSK|nr:MULTISPECIES: YafY family protein [Kitasatospora]BAJ29506.1 putative DeoR family transcriptional regulator [Kitasatospora setae KM-6054]
MADTSARTLRLLTLLQSHRFWPGEELSARLGVSGRTLRRDVDRLRELGYPVEARRGVDGGYQLAAGAALPPLVIDDEEAVALAVGLQAAADGPVEGIAEASVRALAKVVQVMPARLRRRIEALRAVTVPARWGGDGAARIDPDTLTAVALACRDAERLRFRYAAADGTATERHAEPHGLVRIGPRWYLVAYDLTRQDWRTFRLDRLGSPEPTGARFLPRALPATDAAEFVRNGMRNLPSSYRVEVLVDAPAAHVRKRIGNWSEVEETADGRSRVLMRADALEWPAMALGSLDADFRVVSPPELSALLAAWGERFTRCADPNERAESAR